MLIEVRKTVYGLGEYDTYDVSDDLWTKVEPLLPKRKRLQGITYKRHEGAGRPPIDMRVAFTAMIYRAEHKLPWKSLPKLFGASSSIHKYYSLWLKAGVFYEIFSNGWLPLWYAVYLYPNWYRNRIKEEIRVKVESGALLDYDEACSDLAEEVMSYLKERCEDDPDAEFIAAQEALDYFDDVLYEIGLYD